MTQPKDPQERLEFDEPYGVQDWYDIGADLRIEIRHSFYKLKKQNQDLQSKLEKAEAENKRLREALEFYADGNNWEHISPDKAEYRQIKKSDMGNGEFLITTTIDDEWVGGKRAREALKGEGE